MKRFETYDEEWLDFVMSCRTGNVVGDFDIIIGGIADDKIFDTLTLYIEGIISKAEALQRLAYEKPNIQYCIRTEEMLHRHITFKDVVEI